MDGISEQHSPRTLRIHGDNIIECERALDLIASSLSATARKIPSPVYAPKYRLETNNVILFCIEFLPGHGRWGNDIRGFMRDKGAPLREAPDAIITSLSRDGHHERLLLAAEFCSALPAGNNAWQRCGRALSCATIKLPYLHFAEIGGLELDSERRMKRPRFPNPVIPFSYVTATRLFGCLCLPVYSPSPSSSEDILGAFREVFGLAEAQRAVRAILEGPPTEQPLDALAETAVNMTLILSGARKAVDTLRGNQMA